MKLSLKLSAIIKMVFVITIVMANIGCDQVSKHLVRDKVAYQQNISLLGDHFTLTKVENTGAFLSLGDHIPVQLKFVLLTLIPFLLLTGGVVYLIMQKNMPRTPLVAACCVIGGGMGNIYDRLMYGSVTDFMHIGFGFLQTGIFNMADVSVTVGVGVLLVWYHLKTRNEKQQLTSY
jgi:signal peptidase II